MEFNGPSFIESAYDIMDMPQHDHLSQSFGQPPFYYYNPEPGHFSPLPHGAQDGMQVSPLQQQMMNEHAHVLYSRPRSSSVQGMLPLKNAAAVQSQTPLASPRPLAQRPAFLYQNDGQGLSLDTECNAPDLYIYPSTPPLSVPGSTASSPPSTCGVLPTPAIKNLYTFENLEGVKEGCESEVQSEILAGGDWTRCCSPPLTPGKHLPCIYHLIIPNDQTIIWSLLWGDGWILTLGGFGANFWFCR